MNTLLADVSELQHACASQDCDGQQILVVDDNRDAADSLAQLFGVMGAKVSVAYGAQEALIAMTTARPKIAVIDISMPLMNGYELAQELRRVDSTIPIIGVTANALKEEGERCIAVGMNAWLVKPIQLRTLVRTLEKFAPRKRLRPAPAQAGAAAADIPPPPALSEPNVLQTHRQVFVQCMNDDIEMLARGLQERRPDLAAARWRVEAATRGVDVARAQFYPNVNLTAFIGLSSIGLDRLIEADSRQFGVGPAIRLPIFDSGALRANLRGRTAELDAAIEGYNSALLESVRDAADQLSSLQSV